MSKAKHIEMEIKTAYENMRSMYKDLKGLSDPNRPEAFVFTNEYSDSEYEEYKKEKDEAYYRASELGKMYTAIAHQYDEINKLFGILNPFERAACRSLVIRAKRLNVHAYAVYKTKLYQDRAMTELINEIVEEYDFNERNVTNKTYYTTLSRISQSCEAYEKVAPYEKIYGNNGYTYKCWN